MSGQCVPVTNMPTRNSPFILGFRSIVYALGTGNTVIFKGSEMSPGCHWLITDIFRQAGLPDGVLNYIVHTPAKAAEVTAALIEHPLVRKVNFTGSTAVGRIIGGLAGKNLKPALLELGGKAPAIVWDDADIELAAKECATGSFFHAGQICMSTEKIIVHQGVAERFEQALRHAVEKGWPAGAEVQALITPTARDRNVALVKDAVAKGASLLVDGIEGTTLGGIRPTVVKNVTSEMDIYSTESFGPTVSLIAVGSEDEALRIANDTAYGLTSAVFTEDLRRALRLANRIQAGAVHINGMTVHDEIYLPHGGINASGFGRFNSSNGMDEWLVTKSVTFRK